MTNKAVSRNQISLDSKELTHLFGYLTPEQWVDAMSNVDKELIMFLVDVQEQTYGGVKDDVLDLMSEKNI
jgi:hypothetical protein